jgi:polyisoprenoid-binding protein YceI
MKRVWSVLLFPAALLAAQSSHLAADPSQTDIDFTLASLLHTVHGTFKLEHGAVEFDPESGAIGGELVVDARSGQSGGPARDRRMHKEILQSDRFPTIVFRPDRMDGKVAAQGKSATQIHGVFSIHGADHEMVVPAEVHAQSGQYAVTVHFSVPYVKWGMKNPSTLMLRVSDKVEITLHTAFRLANATASLRH